MLNHESRRIKKVLLAIDFRLLVHIGEALILLLDATEFYASSLSPLGEAVLGIRERNHEIKQVLLRQTMTVGGLLDAGLVSLTGAQAHQDLVVAEVAGRVQREVLIPILLRKTQSYFSIEDQVDFAEVFKALDDCLVGDKYAAVQC